MRSIFSFSLCAVLSAVAAPARAASGGAPVTLSQSGYLLNALDQPVSSTLSLKFRVYDDATAGTLQWEGTCGAVNVQDGYYTVVLGSSACVGSTAGGLDPALDANDVPVTATRWLEVETGGVLLLPRLSLQALPNATTAGRALTADLLGTHPASDFALAASLSTVATTGKYADLVNLPATFAPSAHTHPVTDVAGLGSFATRSSLVSGDVTGALGFTPHNPSTALAVVSNGLAVGTNQLVVAGGNVGVNTASPGMALDVVGDVRASGRFFGDGSALTGIVGTTQWATNGTAIGYTTGRVGIGTLSPAVSLDLNARTDGLALPVGTTAQRPASAPTGTMRFNTTLGRLEVFSGAAWVSIGGAFSALGGTMTQAGGYQIHTFTASSTFNVGAASGNVEVLLVGGGGGGGGYTGGGGGAGGVVWNTAYAVTAGATLTVTVGAGGTPGSGSGDGQNGGNSVFGTLTALGGGGGGGGEGLSGHTGGSGGGAGRAGRPSQPGSGTSGQGSNGGSGSTTGCTDNLGAGGGGGGAGGTGTGASGCTSGNGGAGTANAISGSSVTYAAGGGGGAYNGTGGTGGSGLGGNGGGGSAGSVPGAGAANTGSGGGGGGYPSNSTGGVGGSGIVIVRYPL